MVLCGLAPRKSSMSESFHSKLLRPTIVRDGVTMNEISHRKYNYIRAQQLDRQSQGIPLMPRTNGPSLPAWDDKLVLPPSFEEYITNKEKQEDN